jgi:phage baseplate assembly protein gpV
MGYVQEKVQYQTSYTDYMFNEVTNFNSDITTFNGIFGETSRIGQNGAATFSSVKTSTINTPYSTLRINGNVTINGTLTHRGVNGNYIISGANWEF